jgi:hypothetical protein
VKQAVKQQQVNRQAVHINLVQSRTRTRSRRSRQEAAPQLRAPSTMYVATPGAGIHAQMMHAMHHQPLGAQTAQPVKPAQAAPAAHQAVAAHMLQPDHVTMAETVRKTNLPLARMDTAALPGYSASAESTNEYGAPATVYSTTAAESAFTAADRERDRSEWLTMKHTQDPRLSNPFLPERNITMPISSNGQHVVLPPAAAAAATRDMRPRTNQTEEEILEIIAHGAEPVNAPVFARKALGIKHAMYNRPPMFSEETGKAEQKGTVRYRK